MLQPGKKKGFESNDSNPAPPTKMPTKPEREKERDQRREREMSKEKKGDD
jgi:hypothetical protein